jgi:hypothetical protein
MLFLEFGVRNLKLFHGTQIKNLESILATGLVAQKGPRVSNSYGQNGIYLTPDFELAARYGVNMNRLETPVVLELVLSKPKRIKQLQYDPLDRPESAWDEDSGGDWYPGFDTFRYLRDLVPDTLAILLKLKSGKDIGWISRYDVFDADNGLDGLEGMNVYKEVYRFIVPWLEKEGYDHIARDRHRIITAMVKAFDRSGLSDGTEDIDISENGVITRNSGYYENKGQLIYNRNIPPVAIKYVWVRSSDYPEMKEHAISVEKYGVKDLPHEFKNKLEEGRSVAETLAHDDYLDLGTYKPEEYIELFLSLNFDETTDAIKLLRELVAALEEEPEDQESDEWKAWEEKVLDIEERGHHIFENVSEFVDEDWGGDNISSYDEWLKLDKPTAIKLKHEDA